MSAIYQPSISVASLPALAATAVNTTAPTVMHISYFITHLRDRFFFPFFALPFGRL